MDMTKYQEYVEKMIEGNKEAFENFRKTHDLYSTDEDKYQEEFNQEGEKIMLIVKEWEGKLCSQSEKGGYGVFTGGLAEKFQAEVKKIFPLIDHVGIIVKKFELKKIKLS